MKFVPNYNKPALFQVMASGLMGDKPSSKPIMTELTNAYMRDSASTS